MASRRRECKPPCIRCILGAMSELAPLLSFETAGWKGPWPETAADALEQGAVVHFPKLVFELLPAERALIGRGLAVAGAKNISLDPAGGHLGGIDGTNAPVEALRRMMSRFRDLARGLMLGIAPGYGARLETGRTSFRPVEIAGRPPSSWRADDTRLHTDAFPSTPTRGKRILRVFANVDPAGHPRLWRTGEPFEQLAAAFLPRIRPPFPGSAALLRAVRLTRSLRSPYDHYMLRLHDLAKADAQYQAGSPRREIAFGPSIWLVFTDQVPHAALGGRNALEQTFYLPVAAQRHPELAPLKVLERLTGRQLAAA